MKFMYMTYETANGEPTYQELLNSLLVQLKGHEFDCVLGVARGGLVLATQLSHTLGIPLVVASCKTDTSFRLLGTRVLIADDLSDTGDTLRSLMGHIYHCYNDQRMCVRTATLLSCVGTKEVPDFYGIARFNDSRWVIFPWERA